MFSSELDSDIVMWVIALGFRWVIRFIRRMCSSIGCEVQLYSCDIWLAFTYEFIISPIGADYFSDYWTFIVCFHHGYVKYTVWYWLFGLLSGKSMAHLTYHWDRILYGGTTCTTNLLIVTSFWRLSSARKFWITLYKYHRGVFLYGKYTTKELLCTCFIYVATTIYAQLCKFCLLELVLVKRRNYWGMQNIKFGLLVCIVATF